MSTRPSRSLNKDLEYHTSAWTGIVLAGGKSSRMGTDKSQLSLNGKTLIERARDVVRQTLQIAFGKVLDPEIYISGKYPGYVCIADDQPGMGPLGGIVSSARFFNSMSLHVIDHQRCLLFVPVDMPFLRPSTLMPLVRALAEGNEDAALFKELPLPLCLRASDRVLRVLNQLIRSDYDNKSQRAVGHFLAQINCIEVNLLAEQANDMINVNTKEEWLRISGALEKTRVRV